MTTWLTTTDHKKIGVMYIVSTMIFFVLAGVLAMMIRLQLARPENSLIGPHLYNEIFTLHGTAMIFFVVAPFGLGLANFLVPLQVGAPDMAFPRLNATSFWLFAFGGIVEAPPHREMKGRFSSQEATSVDRSIRHRSHRYLHCSGSEKDSATGSE